MSVNTWTATALASEARHWAGSGWRAVEAQHQVATLQLARGRLDDQALLEAILEETKPPVPSDAEGLHWLLFTPFRYPPPAYGSRFRAAFDPGVFYGAEERPTACAEMGYWRLRFVRDSDALRDKSLAVQATLFEFHGAGRAIDLSRPPLDADRGAWTHAADYAATQTLARAAREEQVEVIRYESVRHAGGICLALLTPNTFRAVKRPFRNVQQNWNLLIEPPDLVVWQRSLPDEAWTFRFAGEG